jgi:hypothetical protein
LKIGEWCRATEDFSKRWLGSFFSDLVHPASSPMKVHLNFLAQTNSGRNVHKKGRAILDPAGFF